ncbi:hypothetical protein RJ55_05697 [Drechmeria coniospora]|nr:hypothetical protein RJ55_05697 [Drechmeria coniospora]
MAFGFGNSGNVMAGGAAGGVNSGPDLETIQTEALGFLSVAGDAKVRLTSPWTSLPAPTSSLLSVASRRGLVAAAGPDQVVVAQTEAVRKAFESSRDGSSDIRPFQPHLTLPMPMRVAHIAFTADENYLILSAESGGGLAVYEVQSLLQGSSNPVFELPTNGESLRSLIPNPTPEKAELCAIVTGGGNLHMADLKERRLSHVLKGQVSCISWSTKGKQLCAGLADGSIHQMTPEGTAKGEIPKPLGLGNCHVSSLTWLENNLFLSIHSTSGESPPNSVYHIITREPPSTFTFRKLADPIEPFGSEKVAHHSILRLKDFPPDLQDLLIVSSTASTEVGLLSRSSAPLANDKPANTITGVFTTTELLDDTKRPTLPMTDAMDDSTPIGVALDLSSKERVYKPIPSDEELEESPGPLPGLWILTHEGVLCSWWVVYTDSIRKGTAYSGFSALEGSTAIATPAKPAPTVSAFTPASAAATPAFGAAAQIGQKSSPWAASSAAPTSNTGGATFGSSAFGTPSASGAAFGKPSALGFGQSSQVGMRTSPWASAGASGPPAFGQSGFSNFAKAGNPFAATPDAASSGGGFAGFAKQTGAGGFASVASNSGGASLFDSGSKATVNPFASTSTSKDTVFSAKEEKSSGSVFGATPFKLESSFKPDTQQNEVNEQPTGSSMFGNAFGSALGDVGRSTTPPAKDEDMDAAESTERTPQAEPTSVFLARSNQESTTPTTTPAPTRFGPSPSLTQESSSFGQPSKSNGAAGIFGSSTLETPKSGGFSGFFSQPKDSPQAESTAEQATPNIKLEEEASKPSKPEVASLTSGISTTPKPLATTRDADIPKVIDDAPLPPDFTKLSKPAVPDAPLPPDFGAGLSESEPEADDAPLPPDFIIPKAPSRGRSDIPVIPEGAESDSDLGEDNASEGSGVDVAQDLSPSTDGPSPTPGFSVQSSFDDRGGKSTTDGSKPLFGRISRNAPVFPLPSATSPRSPSPLRGAVSQRVIRSDATRSVSAPGMASQILGSKKPLSQLGASIVSKEKLAHAEDQFLIQHRKLKERQEAEEAQPLVDEEDDEVQKVLASEVEGTLDLDEFIAHSNVAPPAKDSIPSQVEAVYRDINSMIDTLGLNSRAVKAFTKGHLENIKKEGRTKDDLEDPDDWVMCEVSELGEVLDNDLHNDLEDGRVQDLDDKQDACQDVARDMQRLRAKQEDLKRVIMTRLDPGQADVARSLPLSAEQAAQQNELRREFTNFARLLAQAEEALTLLKTRLASCTGTTGRANANAPTVEAVMRTISKMTSMAEKRSGDIDVLETQVRTMRLGSISREGSPMVTPRPRRSIMMSPESTPSRTLRQSLSGSVMSLGPGGGRTSTPRKKASGFSKEEKDELMGKKARRQAILAKFKSSVEKKGVSVWNMEDIE